MVVSRLPFAESVFLSADLISLESGSFALAIGYECGNNAAIDSIPTFSALIRASMNNLPCWPAKRLRIACEGLYKAMFPCHETSEKGRRVMMEKSFLMGQQGLCNDHRGLYIGRAVRCTSIQSP